MNSEIECDERIRHLEMGCTCHVVAPCGWCEETKECYECGKLITPFEDTFSITGCIEDYCEACHNRLCVACSNGIDHENFPPHTNITPNDCDHKSAILTADNLWTCTWGCGMTWENEVSG